MMNSFEEKAREWDLEQNHLERSAAIAGCMKQMIPLNPQMKALEYGAGTGLLSFLLRDQFSEITLMDNSREMLKICEEKAISLNTTHINPLFFNLESMDYSGKFDIIYNLMVLHHVKNTSCLLEKFHSLLNAGGFLAIADLYSEDGSFHGGDADVHKGFDPGKMALQLQEIGFKNCKHASCYTIPKENGRTYPVFLLVAEKI
jgi:2-polyprenyl-3-methyl-5-hydroxy-6-metoxy-1,4-benzoquinol methylase